MNIQEGDICPKCFDAQYDEQGGFGLTKAQERKAGKVVLKNGKYGSFYGCSCFPECQWSQPTQETANARKHKRLMSNAMSGIPRPH